MKRPVVLYDLAQIPYEFHYILGKFYFLFIRVSSTYVQYG
jgi:hypothetical protein